MDEIYTDAIDQYIKGRDWLSSIEKFQKCHVMHFIEHDDTVSEYTCEQYACFREFTNLVNELLERVLADLGCCELDAFVRILEQHVNQKALTAGERNTQQLIETLLSYDDFSTFYTSMVYVARTGVCISFEETADEASALWSNEWLVQAAVAKSLLEAQENGHLEPHEIDLIPWASAIIEMKEMEEQSSVLGERSSNGESNTETRLRELETTLAKERLKVDLLVMQRLAESNRQLQAQMVHPVNEVEDNWEVETYTSAEEELMSLFQSSEDTQDQVVQIKTKCFAYQNITPQAMEEIYLFLKEKIHYQHDLAACQEEIATYIFSRVDQEDAAIIPLLLEWLMLESKGIDLQRRISAMVNHSTDEMPEETQEQMVDDEQDLSWTQVWDDTNQDYYYYNTISCESQWTAPIKFWGVDETWHQDESKQLSDADNTFVQEKKVGNPDESISNISEFARLPGRPSHTGACEAKIDEYEDIGKALEAALEMGKDSSQFEDELKRISEEHEKERQKLELTLQVEHARQKQDLQRRKERKRQKAAGKERKAQTARAEEKQLTMKSQEQEEKKDRKDVLRPALTTTAPSFPKIPGSSHPLAPLPTDLSKQDDWTALLNKSDSVSDRSHVSKVGVLNPTSLRFLAASVQHKRVAAWEDK